MGQAGSHSDERKQLRDSIGVDDTSPLRKVTMRNNFEHFDERLDKWWKESIAHNHIDLIIGPKNTIAGPQRWINLDILIQQPATWYFGVKNSTLSRFWKKSKRFFPKLEAEANKPHWETAPQAPKA